MKRLRCCAHPAKTHLRGRGACMHSTPELVWACPCGEYYSFKDAVSYKRREWADRLLGPRCPRCLVRVFPQDAQRHGMDCS